MRTTIKFSVLTISVVLLLQHEFACAQTDPPGESIAVSALPSSDSIVVRWAPMDYGTWRWGNETGYRIERHTLIRDGVILNTPLVVILEPLLKAEPEPFWEELLKHDQYAAIAAQALFGERFEVDLQQSDVISIVNKVQENEQRFAFALFSADMSPAVAQASGLWYTDRNVRPGEKYLYRVIVNTSDSPRGSVFVGTDDPYELPRPLNFKAEFQEKVVSLKWEKAKLIQYTAWLLERSRDGRSFERVSESPLITVSPTPLNDTRYEYAMDSLPDPSVTYHYRVRGITPFGQVGPPSDPVKGKGIPGVAQVPYITDAANTQNSSIDLRWDFPDNNNDAINGFDIQRANEPNSKFKSLTTVLLTPQRRTFTDVSPAPSNYYKVIAHGKDGEQYSSHIYFAQLVDSIPPAPPSGLNAAINDDGGVVLRWEKNNEADLYGYRVYKAYHRSEELAQITSGPVRETSLADRVDLNTLNEQVYYGVMSIDQHQNHSALSPLLKVELPDKVRPQPPVSLPVKSDASGILLSWRPGASGDIVRYNIYRKMPNEADWLQIHSVAAEKDSIYSYKDHSARSGVKYFYTLIAVDDSALESTPATPVAGTIPLSALLPRISWRKPKINREENALALAWNAETSGIGSFRIFRSTDQEPLTVYKVVDGNQRELTDNMIPGKTYRYRIMASFVNGQNSAMSEELEVQY